MTMIDYNRKANDFRASMKRGVDPRATQKGIEAWKAKQNSASASNSNSDINSRQRIRGGESR